MPSALERLEADMQALARVQILASGGTLPPPAGPQSLPVRAAKNTYRLSKGAAAVVGLLTLLAELLAPDRSIILTVVRAIFEPDVPVEAVPAEPVHSK